MDLGHLTLKRGIKSTNNNEESSLSKEAKLVKDIEDAREQSYTQFKLKLEDVQLIYAHQSKKMIKLKENS
jgi:hypothetical protein